jgi:hypothetical protein
MPKRYQNKEYKMNEGLQILINRMDTNPEEFTNGKFRHFIGIYEEHLDPADLNVYKEKLNQIMSDHFTKLVVAELMADEEKERFDRVAPAEGSLRLDPSTNNYEIFTNKRWVRTGSALVTAGGGGGGSGAVIIKTPTSTHTFTKSGTFTP